MARPIQEVLLEAYRLQSQGLRAQAEAGYRQVLAAQPANVHALNLLGIVCLETGRPEDAARLIARAIDVDGADAEPHANLALALRALGRLEEAAAALRRSLAIQPRNPVALNNLGNLLAELQQPDEAIQCLRAALRLDDRHVPALVNLSGALLAKGQTDGALAAAGRAVELDGKTAAPHNALGDVLLKLTRFDAAAECFQAALMHDADHLDARIGLSTALKELGATGRAEALLREVIALQPRHALALNSLGVLQEQQGDTVGAAASFRAAITANPRHANAYYQLAQLKGAQLSEDEVAATRAFHAEPGLHDELRAPLAFALACIHERARQYAESFDFLAQGQAIKARTNPYDDDKVADYHRRIELAMPEAAAPNGEAQEWPQPVFVLGMPRSGTSLTEQILSSHPLVAGAGELSLMEDTVAEASRLAGKPFPACVPLLSAEQRALLGQFYRERLLRRTSAPRWVVDKTPMNFQYIGFIAAVLPAARIVHCRRDAMDNCLSIFKLPFETAHTYAHDLQALGRYYRHYGVLMAHWARVMGTRMIDLQYEDLVADLPTQTARLVEFLGLQADDRMLEFHKTERLVKTPSASQVRQPIYRDSVQVWRRYGDALQPLAQALELTLDPSPDQPPKPQEAQPQ
jgi:tetratricopeptide (TPR) repeat protein